MFPYFLVKYLVLNEINVALSLTIKTESRRKEEPSERAYAMEPKIINGQPVTIERFPFSVQFFNDGSMCGASILTSWAVLTAGHCFDTNKNVSDMNICVGARYIMDYKGDLYGVLDFYVHQEYNKTVLFSNDIAIVLSNKHLKLGPKAQRALIANSGKWMKENNENFEAIGWGWTEYGGSVSEQGLMLTKLKFVSLKRCMLLHNAVFSEDMFCLYGEGTTDTCKGDSGGGVSWRGMIVGLVSHGDGCAQKQKPSVYSNVWYFRNWINDTLQIAQVRVCDFVDSSGE